MGKSKKKVVCPDPKKGQRCPLCGHEWICGRWELEKQARTQAKAKQGQQQ